MSPELREQFFQIVQDPRYTKEKFMSGLQPASELQSYIRSHGLVDAVNKAYGWDLPAAGKWSVERNNDFVLDIVHRPGYTLERFVAAVKAGKRF
jgi:hypothetical protein